MCPIWQRFGLWKPKVEMDEVAEECQRASGVVCSFIGTRDLIQEHIAFRVWPLADNWEMPKETVKETDEGGLVSHPVLEGKPNANHVRARISYSRTQQLHNMDIITQCSK
jgi:hypothetical protein